jgi:hypothetical protein
MSADLGPPTDFYSLGLVLQELLSGDRTVTGADRQAILKTRLDPSPPISSAVSDDLKPLLRKMLARDPDERFQSAEELLAAIRAYEANGAEAPESLEISDSARATLGKRALFAVVFFVVAFALVGTYEVLNWPGVDDSGLDAADGGLSGDSDVGIRTDAADAGLGNQLMSDTGCGVAGQPPVEMPGTEIVTSQGYEPQTPATLLVVAVPESLDETKRALVVGQLSRVNELLNSVLVVGAGESSLESALRRVSGARCIDASRVVGIGISEGAGAISELACAHEELFSALALISPALREPVCTAHPAATMVFRGGRDGRVPASGGTGCRGEDFQRHSAVIDGLRAANRCGDEDEVYFADAAGVCVKRNCDAFHLECSAPDVTHGWPGLDLGLSCDQGTNGGFPLRDLVERFLTESIGTGDQSSPQTESSGQPGQ